MLLVVFAWLVVTSIGFLLVIASLSPHNWPSSCGLDLIVLAGRLASVGELSGSIADSRVVGASVGWSRGSSASAGG